MRINIKRYGEKGILIQWPSETSQDILGEMKAFIKNVKIIYPDIAVIYHAYHEVYVEFKHSIHSIDTYSMQLQFVYNSIASIDKKTAKKWLIPVCYDEDLVPDLTNYLSNKHLELQQFIQQHTSEIYTVYFTGFLPGFLYLGGLAESLYIKRKEVPSKELVKGTVAIGGQQTGIYPQNSPGGWYGVGYTPISFFDEENSINPTWAKSGDALQFKAISKKELKRFEEEVSLGKFTLQEDKDEG